MAFPVIVINSMGLNCLHCDTWLMLRGVISVFIFICGEAAGYKITTCAVFAIMCLDHTESPRAAIPYQGGGLIVHVLIYVCDYIHHNYCQWCVLTVSFTICCSVIFILIVVHGVCCVCWLYVFLSIIIVDITHCVIFIAQWAWKN